MLSRSQLAAPALVAAALGEIAPSHVRLSGPHPVRGQARRRLAGQVLCGLAVPDDPGGTTQLIAPEDLDGRADLVLAVADGTPRDPLARQRHPVRGALRMARRLLWNKFGAIFAVLFALALAGLILLAAAGHAPGDVLYLGIMDMTGSAFTSPGDNGAEKVAQVLLTADGMALLPLLTAIIVGARLTGTDPRRAAAARRARDRGRRRRHRHPGGRRAARPRLRRRRSSTRAPTPAASRSPATWGCRW